MSLSARTTIPIAGAVLLAVLAAEPASACSVGVFLHRTSLWHRVVDWAPPLAAPVPSVRVYRGVGPRPSETSGAIRATATGCDDLGFIELTFPNEPGDEVVGYTFEILAGYGPEWSLPDTTVRTYLRSDGMHALTLVWIDGATDEQEPLSFVLGIRTVDRAGNRSRTVTRVLVRDWTLALA